MNNEVPESYTNIRGETFTFNDEYFYPVMLKDNGNIKIRKGSINNFILMKDGVYIMGKYSRLLKLDDIYPSYHKVKEVIERWQKEVLEKELKTEILS